MLSRQVGSSGECHSGGTRKGLFDDLLAIIRISTTLLVSDSFEPKEEGVVAPQQLELRRHRRRHRQLQELRLLGLLRRRVVGPIVGEIVGINGVTEGRLIRLVGVNRVKTEGQFDSILQLILLGGACWVLGGQSQSRSILA
jgi:hypothetical protein